MRRLIAFAALLLALLTGTARAGDQVIGFTASASPSAAGLQAAAPRTALPVSLPSADAPNAPGQVSIPPSISTPPVAPQLLSTTDLQALWRRAGQAYGIPWSVLGAINKIESNFGRNMGPSSAGAVGWMQFMPSTWDRWGTDADGSGVADPWNAADGVYSAARYLAAAGGATDISRAVYAYNHADWYVNEVLSLARVYDGGGVQQTASIERLQVRLDAARGAVVRANRALVRAIAAERRAERVEHGLAARARHARLLSDRLAFEQRAVQFTGRVDAARAATEQVRGRLVAARNGLVSARAESSAASFAPGVSTLMAAPDYQSSYVFPVGGGAQIVSVSHHHHDYPAADIAAPEGSPVYALSDATVENAWHLPDARCGIGLTIRAADGLVWTYCHLAYLEPTVHDGVTLSAGAPIGLVGHTGHASGPHLHLQLQPATRYPQAMPWFQRFAGTAFTWQDSAPAGYYESYESPLPAARTLSAAAPAAPAEPSFQIVAEPAAASATPVIGFTPERG